MSKSSQQIHTSAADPTAYVYFHPASAGAAILRNTSAVSITYTANAGSTSDPLAAGASKLIDLTSSASQIGVKRTDEDAAAVSVVLNYELEVADLEAFVAQFAGAMTSAGALTTASLVTGAARTAALTTNGGLQTFGADDSAGAGFRLVKVPNTVV